jgi:hypothetical protein
VESRGGDERGGVENGGGDERTLGTEWRRRHEDSERGLREPVSY